MGTVSGAWRESPPLAAVGLTALGAGAACMADGVLRIARDRSITPYKAPQYWLTYRNGLVRRALPGAVLSRATGGSPTMRQVCAAAVGLTLTGSAAVVALAVSAGQRAPDDLRTLLTTAAVLSSPLSGSLLLQDVGRFDAVGVSALAALAAPEWAWAQLPPALEATVLATLLAGATAAEEFLLGQLAPVALARTGHLARRRRLGRAGRLGLAGAVLAPAAAVAVASAVVKPPAVALTRARDEARANGAGRPDEMGDALSAVERDLVENMGYFRLFEPADIARALALWSGVFAATVVVLDRLLAGEVRRRHRRAAGYQVSVAAALSVLGVDFRRWWGLGLLGTVASVAASAQDRTVAPVGDAGLRRTAAAVAGLAAANIWLRDRVVYPVRRRTAAQEPTT